MLETNIRIVRPGPNLFLWVRHAALSGPDITMDLMEKACSMLRRRHGLAAVVATDRPKTLLVATHEPFKPIHLEEDEWTLDVMDSGEPAQHLTLETPEEADRVVLLIERALLAMLARRTDLWTLDSPRILYEAQPFVTREGIAAYRRYEVGTVLIDGVGVGLAVDVGTTFFSVESLAYFFNPNVSAEERRRRENTFTRWTRRQEGQKGTLLYDNGRSHTKCYFESPAEGITCATTGTIKAKGKSYNSLLDYYRAQNPDLPVSEATPVVRVSFTGLDRPQYVAADRVRVRIMNEDVPETLNSVDKIAPNERRQALHDFWAKLGPRPLGDVAPGLSDGFWRPEPDRVIQFPMPALFFGQKRVLPAPEGVSAEDYREHYRQRLNYLKDGGCYSTPAMMTRTLYCAYPRRLDPDCGKQLATHLAKTLGALTKKEFTIQLVDYESVSEAIETLRDASENGLVVFVLNDEPAAYYEAAYRLHGWRLKRITQDTLNEHYRYWRNGAWDRKLQARTAEAGQKRWKQFVVFTALDVLQLLEAVPYRIEQAGPYDAQLIIDVGHDRRQFALSLLIARRDDLSPSFQVVAHVYRKPDHQHEAINAVMLADQIVDLFQKTFPRKYDALQSLLIMRDGRFVDHEPEGIANAMAKLKDMGYLAPMARVDLVDIHKDTLKSIRLWSVNQRGQAENALEGIAARLNNKAVVMTTTGIATLKQGTADPILVVGNGQCANIVEAAQANFAGAQLNWSSPGVAQRLHIGLKRTDDDLKARAAQEIRRLR